MLDLNHHRSTTTHVTVTFKVLLPTASAQQLRQMLCRHAGGVVVHVPGAHQPATAHLVVNGQVVHLMEIRHNLGIIDPGTALQALSSLAPLHIPGLQLLWLGRMHTDRSMAVHDVNCLDAQGLPSPLPPILCPALASFKPRDACCLIGLALGGQAIYHSQPQPPTSALLRRDKKGLWSSTTMQQEKLFISVSGTSKIALSWVHALPQPAERRAQRWWRPILGSDHRLGSNHGILPPWIRSW
jgi:hypothetical protein